jgi:hypothetical protein
MTLLRHQIKITRNPELYSLERTEEILNPYDPYNPYRFQDYRLRLATEVLNYELNLVREIHLFLCYIIPRCCLLWELRAQLGDALPLVVQFHGELLPLEPLWFILGNKRELYLFNKRRLKQLNGSINPAPGRDGINGRDRRAGRHHPLRHDRLRPAGQPKDP